MVMPTYALGLISIIFVAGLSGAVALESLSISHEAEANGACTISSIPFNASKGRCYH
jgi:hypothetical protein